MKEVSLIIIAVYCLFGTNDKLNCQEVSHRVMREYSFLTDSIYERRDNIDIRKFLRSEVIYDTIGRIVERAEFKGLNKQKRVIASQREYHGDSIVQKYYVNGELDKISRTIGEKGRVTHQWFDGNTAEERLTVEDTLFKTATVISIRTVEMRNGDTSTVYSDLYEYSGISKQELTHKREVQGYRQGKPSWDRSKNVSTHRSILSSSFLDLLVYVDKEGEDTTYVSVTTIDKVPDSSIRNVRRISTNYEKGFHHEKTMMEATYVNDDQLKIAMEYILIDGVWKIITERQRDYDELGRVISERTRRDGDIHILYFEYE